MAKEMESVDWQVLPFYRSLAEQVLMLGVPKVVLILNGLVGFIFVMNFHFWYILIVNAIVHFGAIYLAKNDDQFFECLQNYQSKKNFYST